MMYQRMNAKKLPVQIMLWLMTISLIAAIPVLPGNLAFAANDFKVELTAGSSILQNDSTPVSIDITNQSGSSKQIKVELSGNSNFTITNNNPDKIYTLGSNTSIQANFKVTASRTASTGTNKLTVTIKDNSNNILQQETVNIDVSQGLNPGGVITASFDMISLSNNSEINAGEVKTLSFEIFNRGNTFLKNTVVTIVLPDEMSVYNGSSSVNLGYITVGSTGKAEFPILVDKDAATKSYPVVLKISGVDSENVTYSEERTFYVSVVGKDKEEYSMNDIVVSPVSIPESVNGSDPFNISFSVSNKGTTEIKNLRVTVEVPEGLANKTRNIFSVPSLAAGASQSCSVTMFAGDDKTEKYYPIKITIDPLSEEDKELGSVTQYTGIYVYAKESAAGAEKTPQLIVQNYGYGGSYARAGDHFRLSMTLLNASNSHVIKNIKVTVTSDDGTFVPYKTSNSFYVDSIGKKGTVSQNMMMSVKPDAEQKTSSITVAMSYEDEEGNAFTASDVISVPVQQEMRLVVNDIMQNPDVYVGMESSINVEFRNEGKGPLNNLKISAEGNFQLVGSQVNYIGNMASGASDYFGLMFIPNEAGQMIGSIIFTYEDGSGEEIVYEKPFEFTVMDGGMMEDPWGDPGMEIPEPSSGGLDWKWIAGIAAAILIIIGIVFWRKRRKRKNDQELEIDD